MNYGLPQEMDKAQSLEQIFSIPFSDILSTQVTNREDFIRKFALPPQAIKQCDDYAALLQKWGKIHALVARDDLPNPWARHFDDSAILWPLIRCVLGNARRDSSTIPTLYDLGSGAGFPALIFAIFAQNDNFPKLRIRCVESNGKKVSFLRQAVQTLSLQEVEIIHDRIENLPAQSADIITARALAPLPQLLSWAEHLSKPSGVAIFPKGKNWLTECPPAWHITQQLAKQKTAQPKLAMISHSWQVSVFERREGVVLRLCPPSEAL